MTLRVNIISSSEGWGGKQAVSWYIDLGINMINIIIDRKVSHGEG